jgi:periplasmic divalent cation tolerance protein
MTKLLVLTTAGSEAEARKIAGALLERRLAACVNLIPQVHSLYWWEGKVESADEYLLLIKTVKAQEEAVRAAIGELHSYQLPECIALAIDSGSKEYLKWIEDCLPPGPEIR